MSREQRGPLAGVAAKVQQADLGISQLEQMAIAWSIQVPHSAFREAAKVVTDRAAGGYRVSIELPSVPLEVSVVLGEVLHNLRSALDHLAWVLVLASGGEPSTRPGGTAFPLLLEDKGHGASIKPALNWPEAEALVNAVQPFSDPEKRGTKHPLYQLHDLNLIDKHRLLNVTTLAGTGNIVFRPRELRDEPIPADYPRHAMQLVDMDEQFVKVDGELIDDAEVSGLWAYTVVVGEKVGSWPQGIDGLCRSIRDHLWNEVVLPFDTIILNRLRAGAQSATAD